jgi:hypothetical protein
LFSLGRKSNNSTPSSGKKVTRVSGCKRNSIICPRFYELFQK